MSKTYFGTQTKQALHNFPFPLPKVDLDFIYAITSIKKAAATANAKTGNLQPTISTAIIKACDEILHQKHDEQFVTVALQGGAGTSIHMNVNEVIATRATELVKNKVTIHPNDHVNMSQSTNDVNPSALRIACVRLSHDLVKTTDHLIHTFKKKATECKHIPKLGRTHMQDAVPTTLGAEFNSYASILERDKNRITQAMAPLYELNMGGTAIGNSINASEKYIIHFYKEIKKLTRLPVKQGANLMALTSNLGDICALSAALNILCLNLSKIATDLRFMASGPHGGIGEIMLTPLQPGSSIMPGKVNPVLPESMNQVYYFVSGKNLTIHQAAEASHLELALMTPVVADAIITSLKLVTSALRVFADKCVASISPNSDRCKELLEKSTAYATLLTPVLGYDVVSELVKEANATNQSLREISIERKLLSPDEFDSIVSSSQKNELRIL